MPKSYEAFDIVEMDGQLEVQREIPGQSQMNR
jgi:hypothetical protein